MASKICPIQSTEIDQSQLDQSALDLFNQICPFFFPKGYTCPFLPSSYPASLAEVFESRKTNWRPKHEGMLPRISTELKLGTINQQRDPKYQDCPSFYCGDGDHPYMNPLHIVTKRRLRDDVIDSMRRQGLIPQDMIILMYRLDPGYKNTDPSDICVKFVYTPVVHK